MMRPKTQNSRKAGKMDVRVGELIGLYICGL